jgi:hypothetical protein
MEEREIRDAMVAESLMLAHVAVLILGEKAKPAAERVAERAMEQEAVR